MSSLFEKYKRPEGFEKEALANFKLAEDSNKDQAEREQEDLSWQVPENQWDDAARAARTGKTGGDIAVPARPMLSIPKIKQPMAIVDNQFRSAHLGVNIHPISDDADDDTAEVYQDLYRAMERDSNAGQARWWAFDRAKQAGRGWYRLNTVYDEQTEDPFDQKVVIERILYQSAVLIDPSATKADCSDANWGFHYSWLPIDVFKRRWPDSKIASIDESSDLPGMQLDELVSQTPNWVKNNGEKKAIRVTEYWYKHYIPETVTSRDGKRKRTKDSVLLMWYVLAPGGENGLEIVEEQEWNGEDIPLIPAFGTELQPFDEERRYEGMVRPARDGQRLYNFTASTAVEKMASLPKAPWLIELGQIEGYEQVWQQSNTRMFPYLPYKATSLDGKPIPPPNRVPDDGAGLQPIMAILQQADEFIQSSTATPDPVLGRRNSKSESGRAIQALQGQSEAANSSFIQNFADVTMMYEAKVGIGMLKRVYDRPGRVARVLNIQGDGRKVILNQDFVMKDGKPIPVPSPALPGQTTTMQPQAPNVKRYDLSKGYYGVSVTIGKSFNTKREQGVELLNAIMERAPELGIVLAPVMLRFMDGPGMKEAAELAKEFRDMQMPGLGKGKEGEETPDQLKAQLKAAQAQIQQMQEIGQKMQQEIEQQQAKAQAEIEKVRIKAEADAQNTALKAQAEGQNLQAQAMLDAKLAEIQAEAEERLEQIRQEAELARQNDQQAFEMAKLALEQRFEALQAELDRKQQAEMAVHQAKVAEANADRDDMRSEREAERGEEKEGEE